MNNMSYGKLQHQKQVFALPVDDFDELKIPGIHGFYTNSSIMNCKKVLHIFSEIYEST